MLGARGEINTLFNLTSKVVMIKVDTLCVNFRIGEGFANFKSFSRVRLSYSKEYFVQL